MTQAEKLEALVRKATDNGFTFKDMGQLGTEYIGIDGTTDWCIIKLQEIGGEIWRMLMQVLIFNHDFARVLFGTEMVRHMEVDDDGNAWQFSSLAYQYYPMHAVISDDPIEYMYKVVFQD